MKIPSKVDTNFTCSFSNDALAELKENIFISNRYFFFANLANFLCLRGSLLFFGNHYLRHVQNIFGLLCSETIENLGGDQRSEELVDFGIDNKNNEEIILLLLKVKFKLNKCLEMNREKSSWALFNAKFIKFSLLVSICLTAFSMYTYWDYIPIVTHFKIERAKVQLREIQSAIVIVKQKYNLPLSFFTKRDCTYCPCRNGKIASRLDHEDPCVRQWQETARIIFSLAGWDSMKINKYLTDPWGAPFGLNELDEPGQCREDILMSAGPNGKFGMDGEIRLKTFSYFCQ